jgi:hypothetical protein
VNIVSFHNEKDPPIEAHTINPKIPILIMAYTIPRYPKIGFFENVEMI